VKFHYNKVPKNDILTCINGFYTDKEVSQAKKLILLLCFVKFHYGKVPKNDILTCINGFYTDKEVSQAKKLIFQVLDGVEPKVSDPPRCISRKESNSKRRLECEDILGALECCDKNKVKLPTI